MKLPAMNTRSLGLAGVLIGLLALFGNAALRSGPLAPVEVTEAVVQSRTLSPALFGVGSVEARYSQRVGPIGTGRLLALEVDVGDVVQAGQVLGRMDPVDLDERIASLQASLRRMQANRRAATAQIEEAIARHEYAQSQERRYEMLSASGSISREAIEAKHQELRVASAGLQSAQANADAAVQAVEEAQAGLAALHQQRQQLELRAPLDGLVAARKVEPGTTVMAGQTVLEIIDSRQVWLNVRFDQRRAGGLQGGLPARIELRSRAAQTLSGQVLRVEPLADAVTEEILAKVIFDAVPNPLPPLGELGEVTVALPGAAALPVIPSASVQRREGVLGVWLIVDEALRFVPVTLGASDLDGDVQVLAGLREGDRVVRYSQRALTPRSRIRIVERLTADAS